MKHNVLEDYLHLKNIFRHNWNPSYGKFENHPLVELYSKSKNLKYTSMYRSTIKFELKNLEKNFHIVKRYLNGKNTKVKELEKRILNPEQYYETITEIIWFAKWISSNLSLDIEPLGKNISGPDAKLNINDKEIFCEITSMQMSEGIRKKRHYEKIITENISCIKPKYTIHITINRKIIDEDIECISEIIKKEIVRNNGENHFQSSYDDFYLDFSSSFSHYVKIHYIPSICKITSSTINKRDRIQEKIHEKIKQLNEAGDNVKILIFDYGRHIDALESHPMFFDSYIQSILGSIKPLGNRVLKFDSSKLNDLSGIITMYHTDNGLYSPACYINDNAKHIIDKKEVMSVACML